MGETLSTRYQSMKSMRWIITDARGGHGRMTGMRFGIVEGEPGIFPDPIARLLRLLGRPFKRDRQEENPAQQEEGPGTGSA